MSSSAFTPSTTTVTNNVPVNVPVVTAWESYTPTFSAGVSFGSTGGSYWAFRRVGENLQISARVTLSGTGININGTDGSFVFSLPTGLTFRNLVGIANARIGYAQIYDGTTNLVMAHIEQFASETNRCNVYIPSKTLTGQSSNATTALTFAGGNAVIFITVDVPISQWASSGTTTLATRAVEEYAFNNSSSTNGNSNSFAYGIQGTPFLSYSSGANVVNSYTVRFQTPIQSTDKIVIEVSPNRSVWHEIPAYALSGGNTISQFGHSTTSYFGIGIRPILNNSTDVDVAFGGAGTNSNLDAWSSFSGWYWRLRKVASGAQVGYPVSARNIVGDTSGSVVPVGMLGEILTFTARGGLVTTGGWRIPDTSPLVTLTAGSWMIYGRLLNTVGIAAGTTSMTGAISNSSVAGTGVGVPAVYGRLDNAFVAAGSGLEAPLSVNYVTVSQGSTLPLYAQFISSGANNTINISGYAVRIA